MTYFEDTGSVLDAPIEYVWEYLMSEEHGSAHARSARNFAVKETVGPTSVVSAERLLRGQWSPFVSKTTDFPPFAVINEEVEGDFAGTKFVVLYRPHGNQTRVDVYGDVRSDRFDLEHAKRLFLELLTMAYEDDVAKMKQLRRR